MPIFVLPLFLLLGGLVPNIVLVRYDDSDQRKAKLEASPFQGQWKVTVYKIRGDEAPENIREKIVVTILNDKFTLKPMPVYASYPKTGKRVWELEDSFEAKIEWGKPGELRSFEMVSKSDDETVIRLKGISRVVGDTLQICFTPTEVAPTSFESGSSSSNRLLYLKQVNQSSGPKNSKP